MCGEGGRRQLGVNFMDAWSSSNSQPSFSSGDGGDMYDYIMKHRRGLPEDQARKYFIQILEAINYCHKLHVVHRDLKPENVVFFEKLGIVKLTDFGFSNLFHPGEKLETSCGSLAYSAPEILLGDSYEAPAVGEMTRDWSRGAALVVRLRIG